MQSTGTARNLPMRRMGWTKLATWFRLEGRDVADGALIDLRVRAITTARS